MVNKSEVNILIVDDERYMLKLLALMLENLGYHSVSTCENGHAALGLIDMSAARPDLILLDLNMPEMDGFEFLCHLVKRSYSGSLILVSCEDERMRQAAEKLAQAHHIIVLGHLHKLALPQGLSALVEKWMPPQQDEHPVEKKIYTADEVRAAIANGELVNYYQPMVEIATGYVTGVETLVRWRHPVDGIVFPDQFVGVAEAHGMIDDLTLVILTQALAQARLWQDAGIMLQVAVNLSMDNLASPDYADMIVGLAVQAGVPPKRIKLEVTESRIMEDLRIPLEILARLRLKRFKLSIDDFGIGNSSLAQLRDLPFDELKIDQSFVHGACNDAKLQAIFDSSLGLAKRLGMVTVAEGVEDQDDWDFVRAKGCDFVQGYFIAQPMTAADLPDWIQSWQKTFSVFNHRT